MLTHRQLTFDDYWRVFRRRAWIMALSAILLGGATYAGSRWIHNRYTSRTVVLVEKQFAENLGKGDLSDDERVTTIRERILSTPNLDSVIRQFGLYPKETGLVPMDELASRMRTAIVIEPVRGGDFNVNGGFLPGFSISYTHINPRVAQQVCAQLASIFTEDATQARTQKAEDATDFLKDQLAAAKTTVDQAQDALGAFRAQHNGQLLGQNAVAPNQYWMLNTQQAAIQPAIERAQEEKSFAEAELRQRLSTWQAQRNSDDPQALQDRIKQKQTELMELLTRYTPNHPDVVKAEKDLAALKSQLAQTPAAASNRDSTDKASSLPEPIDIVALRRQVQQADATVREKQSEQQQVEREIRELRAQLQAIPVVEGQAKAFQDRYQLALDSYNDLQKKMATAQTAAELAQRNQTARFHVIEPANLPTGPTYPNRLLFAGAGSAVGFALGLGLVVLLELTDKALRDEKDILEFLQLPTLAVVPLVGNLSKRQRRNLELPRTKDI